MHIASLASFFSPQYPHPCTNKFIRILSRNPGSPGTAQKVKGKSQHTPGRWPRISRAAKVSSSSWLNKRLQDRDTDLTKPEELCPVLPMWGQSIKKNRRASVKYSGTTLCIKETSCLISNLCTKFP